MRAMVLEKARQPLQLMEITIPEPGPEQVLIRIHACGVCRTDLHIVDGDLSKPKPHLIPGHEIIGTVVQTGSHVEKFNVKDRIGVPWLGYTDGKCYYCKRGQENLCENALFTGYTIDGGFAEYAVADQRYCFPIPEKYSDVEAAPLLCAGLIGYRSYRMAGEGVEDLGLYGFGASAHVIAQIAIYQGKRIYAFTRPGDVTGQEFAYSLGAVWAGDSTKLPPDKLDAAIIFAPVGPLLPAALKATKKGGTVVCAGIYMSDIPSFPYHLLWEERVVRSVANLTRQDGEELLAIAPEVPVKTKVQVFPLEQANKALDNLRKGKIKGAAVLKI
ncbi:MAG: alcohol dehydrogenase [candidate division Zixibacteria bacterium 4484_95]|nr:MAG: alcohol dehydrogenase [candidate division Zixibacteria bacterium 4484_95]RKX20121.1 MAG: alcohol dehydrogenase [candidate division Zixibacteria bacterium]